MITFIIISTLFFEVPKRKETLLILSYIKKKSVFNFVSQAKILTSREKFANTQHECLIVIFTWIFRHATRVNECI